MLIQLPDDVVAYGYKQVKPFHYEQVFSSVKVNFTGTELEFVVAGFAYKYIQIDANSRRVFNGV